MGAPKRQLPPALAANRWRPGQSGNPSGHSGEYGEAMRLARQAAPRAILRLMELAALDRIDEQGNLIPLHLLLGHRPQRRGRPELARLTGNGGDRDDLDQAVTPAY